MSNPIYDMMKQMETQKDIAEISAILSGYENANGRNRALDMQASEKIMEMQGKDLAIYAVTAPKPGTPGIPWSEVPPTQLYNILINIKHYLDEKLLDEIKKQQEGKEKCLTFLIKAEADGGILVGDKE